MISSLTFLQIIFFLTAFNLCVALVQGQSITLVRDDGLASTDAGSPKDPISDSSVRFIFDNGERVAPPYECSLDGAAFTSCVSPLVLSGLADGLHSFTVRTAAATAPASVQWTIDTTAPQLNITSKPALLLAPGASAAFVFDADELVTFECDVDSSGFGPCDDGTSGPTTQLSIASSDLARGRHSVTVRAVDLADNLSPAQWYSFTIDDCVTAQSCAANPCAEDSDPANDGCACGPGLYLDLTNYHICRNCQTIANCQTNALLHCSSQYDSVCGDCDDYFDSATQSNFYDCRLVTIYT